jgi:hypothetical protein
LTDRMKRRLHHSLEAEKDVLVEEEKVSGLVAGADGAGRSFSLPKNAGRELTNFYKTTLKCQRCTIHQLC